MNNPSDFIAWLNALLAERKQLRHLLHKRLISFRHADSAKQVPPIEKEIAELIEGPLSLSKRETPGLPSLVSVASEMLYSTYGSYTSPRSVEEPDTVWQSWGHANTKTADWPEALKARLQLLTAPLDKALTDRLDRKILA